MRGLYQRSKASAIATDKNEGYGHWSEEVPIGEVTDAYLSFLLG